MPKILSTWKPQNETIDQYLDEIGLDPVSWNLDALIKLRGVSAKKLARSMSYSDAMVNNWRKSPTIPRFKLPRDAVRNLCRALNCDPIHLFGDPSVIDELEGDTGF